ncbi:MAG: peptidoglycan D,D-transpeptidase FtsI family protein [Cellvibrionaceae bacterium]
MARSDKAVDKSVRTSKSRERKKVQATSRAARSPSYQPAIIRWRYFSICGFLVCLAVLLVWKVASIQVLPSQDRGFEFLQKYGQSQFIRGEEINANRGVITDRNGEPLAVSTEVVSICGNPKVLLENKQAWQVLASAIDVPAKELADKIGVYANKEFMYLKRRLPPAQAKEILALEIPGIFSRTDYQRYYPAGEVTAHVVGLTSRDGNGVEGTELSYDEWLRGVPGLKQVVKDLKGRTIEDVRLVKAAVPGNDLALSIDLRLQYLAYRELKRAVASHKAVAGSVVIVDTYTGEILAMVNQPSYNPNNRQTVSPVAMKNRAVTDQFEPGSTMKPITVLAALESKKYFPHTKIDTSPGRIKIKGKTIFDPVNYGVIDVSKIVAKSSQVGITKIALELEPESVRDMFYRMGIGESTGSGFPGESTGSLPNHQKWHPVERATLAYGYGLTVTTLQLAHAYSVFANDGMKADISMLKVDERDSKTSRHAAFPQAVDSLYANQVLSMMETVIEPGGTGTRARLDSFTAAGKTGTAHKASQGGYLDEAKFSVFAGVAPVKKPRIAVAIMIDEPRSGLYGGGEVAAPIFSTIAEGALRLLQTPPDKVSPQQLSGSVALRGSLL